MVAVIQAAAQYYGSSFWLSCSLWKTIIAALRRKTTAVAAANVPYAQMSALGKEHYIIWMIVDAIQMVEFSAVRILYGL